MGCTTVYLYLGIIYRKAGNSGVGFMYFNRAIEVAAALDDFSTAYAMRGLVFGNPDPFEGGFADFEPPLKSHSDHGIAVFIEGTVFENLGKCNRRLGYYPRHGFSLLGLEQ
jgi:hypothetical protein